MSYTALYRKFRPDNYNDVKGQEHITTTLSNQIVSGRIGHAYLFCGTRGTGKTTVAKIFAKAVNCEHPVNGNPCNECPTCKAISAGISMNVIEMDAASNNGVENIRQIVDEVQYRPTEGRYKVYIVDEVHMLSTSAFNALLKTLEEPPEYVIFILATTEAHKIPITILSRCQRYDFKHISVDVIKDRLKELADIEHMEVEDKALRFIAKTADGSLRDALSLLDQCEAFSIGEALTYDKTLDILGAVDTDVFSNMLRAVISENTVECMKLLEEMISYGRDLSQFVVDFTWYLRNMLLLKTSDDADEIIDMSSERLEALKEEAGMLDVDTIMRYIRILSELTNQIKYSSQKRVLIEIGIIKLMQPAMEVDYESLKNRVYNIEKKLENGILIDNMSSRPEANINENSNESDKVVKKLEMAIPEEIKKVADNWQSITRNITGHLGVGIRKNRLSIDENSVLCIVYDSSIDWEQDNRPDNIKHIKDEIARAIGKEVPVELRCLNSKENYETSYMSLDIDSINFNVEEVNDENEEEEDF